MFSNQDEYLKATREARIYSVDNDMPKSIGVFLLTLFLFTLLVLVSYYSYFYISTNNTKSYETNVMGVSHTYNEDEALMNILNSVEVERLMADVQPKVTIKNAISKIVNESEIKTTSTYAHLISKEKKEQDYEEKIFNELKSIN